MKTTTGRKLLKRESHFQVKRNVKKNKFIQETRGSGEHQRERLGYVLESGV